MARDSASTVIATLQRAGFRGQKLRDAFGIVMAESSGDPDAHNPNAATGDDSYGYGQINMLGSMGPARRKQYGLRSNADLFDRDTNARVMFRLSGGGRDFSPWTTYTSGKYRAHKFPGAAPSGDAPGPAARRAPARGTIPLPSASAMRPASDPRVAFALQLIGRSRARRGETASSPLMEALAYRARQQQRASRPAPMTVDQHGHVENGHAHDKPTIEAGTIRTDRGWKPTHITDGLDWNNGRRTAGDIMARPGTAVGAPADGQIVRWGSAQGGQALYFDDNDPDSEPDYWLGHIDDRLPVGTRVRRGQRIARVSRDHAAPHLHIDRRLA